MEGEDDTEAHERSIRTEHSKGTPHHERRRKVFLDPPCREAHLHLQRLGLESEATQGFYRMDVHAQDDIRLVDGG